MTDTQSAVVALLATEGPRIPESNDTLTVPILLGGGLGVMFVVILGLFIVYRRKLAAQTLKLSASAEAKSTHLRSTRQWRAVVPTKQRLPLLPTVAWSHRETLSHKFDTDSASFKGDDDEHDMGMSAFVPSLNKAPSSPSASLFAQPNVQLPMPTLTPTLSRCSTVTRKPVPKLEVEDVDSEMVCAICTKDYEAGDELRTLDCAGEHQYHVSCIDAWLISCPVCPLCRSDVEPREFSSLDSFDSFTSFVKR